MNSKATILVTLLAAIVLAAQPASGQNTEPGSTFDYYTLTSGVRVSGSSCYVDDFGISVVNQHAGSISVHLWLEDSGYTFKDSSVGTYDYGTYTVDSRYAWVWNVLTIAVQEPANGTCGSSTNEFSGHVKFDSGTTGDFYVFAPTSFTVTSPSAHSSWNDADHDAWQNCTLSGLDYCWAVPWYWDSNNDILISPYANHWNQSTDWDKGWRSDFTVTNNASQSVDYVLLYRKHEGAGGLVTPQELDPNSSCASSNLTNSGEAYVSTGNTWVTDIRTIFNPHSTYAVEEDGWVYISAYPLVGGASPTHYIREMSTGSFTTC